MNRLPILFPAIALIALAPIVAPAQVSAPNAQVVQIAPANPGQLRAAAAPASHVGWPWSLYARPDTTGCPVGLRAQREVTLGTVIVKNGEDDRSRPKDEITQRLHMTLTNSNPHDIVGMQITVHGFPAKARAVPTLSTESNAPELKQTIALKINVGSNQNASTDLRLRAFTAVRLLDVDSVDYADGSSWHASAHQGCHVEPDGFMLVSSH
jgi:hypothetical protein